MHDLKQLLKIIVTSVAGVQAGGVVDSLYEKKNVNEFLIAKKLKLTINQTRNILYKLADEGLVSFIRKKDAKKGGWYTYFWTFNMSKSLQKYREMLTRRKEEFEQHLHAQKTGRFFVCSHCHAEFTEDAALLHDYTCPECGEVLLLKDTAPAVSSITKDIAKVAQQLQQVSSILQILLAQEEKVRQRRIKAIQRKKVKERAVKRAASAQERKKLASQTHRKKKSIGQESARHTLKKRKR